MANANDTRDTPAPANNAAPAHLVSDFEPRAPYAPGSIESRIVFSDQQMTNLRVITLEEAEARAKATKAKLKRLMPRKTSAKPKPAPVRRMQTERFLTVATAPGTFASTPWIRLAGRWLEQAGFSIRSRVRVQVEEGRLIITPEGAST